MSEPAEGRPPRIHDADPELQKWVDKAYEMVRDHTPDTEHPSEVEALPVQGFRTEDIRADDVYRALEEILGRPVERGAPLPDPDELPPGVEPPDEDQDPDRVKSIGHLWFHKTRTPHSGH